MTLSKEEIAAIVREEMPGFRVSESEDVEMDGPRVRQMRSPGLAQIQRKLREQVKPYTTPESVTVTDATDEDEVEQVTVVPERGSASREKKTVLISSAKKTIIGSQG